MMRRGDQCPLDLMCRLEHAAIVLYTSTWKSRPPTEAAYIQGTGRQTELLFIQEFED
jgi:hypothetical protein